MIKVLHPGLMTSIQDMGRKGVAKYGVPESGVMDEYSANYANLMLQNEQQTNLIEITLQGPKLQFESDAVLVCSGLDAKIVLNSKPVSMHTVFEVKKGDVFHIQQVTEGNYVYLGCKGGFETETILGSTSFYTGVTKQAQLQKGDFLNINSITSTEVNASTETHSNLKYKKGFFDNDSIEVYKGPEFNQLTQKQQKQLFQSVFHLSKNYNRMAFQLEESFDNELSSIMTSPVIPGTVQLTPDGKLIILMKDAQTTGGYPRVLQLTQKAIFKLAQKRQQQNIQFQQVADVDS
jgi:biotin-dependent carboxylase-like uncharacterized protein